MVETASGQTATLKGSALVLGILLLAAGLGAFAVWFQWGQTRRCLAFLGPVAARRIQLAPQVELWMLAADGTTIRAIERLDVSQAPGLVHLRRGLSEDVNYRWEGPVSAGAEPPLSPSSWDVAFAFFDPGAANGPADGGGRLEPGSATVLAIDLDDGGAVTVVGNPGRVALARLAPGLRTWINDTRKEVFSAEKPGF